MLLLLACLAQAPSEASEASPPTPPPTPARTVAEAFPPPEGAVRVDGGDFGAWLAALPIAPADQRVLTHDGRPVDHQARVIELDMVKGDLQQCADSAIRVRAEFLKAQGEPILFHATSGDPLPWARYAGGETPYVVDDRVQWKAGSGSWESYLRAVFMWAGTASLEAYDTNPVDTPRPGDLLVEGGFPGHAVLLLDVATRDGQTLLLIGEGFMPAQSFHVELGPEEGWWVWEPGLELPHWTLGPDSLRRWR